MSDQATYKSHQERLMMEALDIISGARRSAYGPPERNFERIAALWNGYCVARGATAPGFDAIDVCHLLDLVKLARLIETPDHEDSIRDRFGYQGCYVDLALSKEPEPAAAGTDGDVPGDQIWWDGEWRDWPPANPANGGSHATEPVVLNFQGRPYPQRDTK